VCEDVVNCLADFDGNRKVSGTDVSLLVTEYGRRGCNPDNETKCCKADADENGKVTGTDISLLVEQYGRRNCPYRTPPCTEF
jgi:hypothetical protein